MAAIIVYKSQHGCTEMCANELAKNLKDDATLVNLKKMPDADITEYETVLIGGSIHVGRIQKAVKLFCEKNFDTLLTKRIGLFICCMEEGEKAREEFDSAFPEQLREHAKATGIFGGAFNFDRMNFIEKTIVKKVANIDKSVSKVNEDAIGEFIGKMNQL
jgi:menaquinone-dependent protoporphyrinogen oxidase